MSGGKIGGRGGNESQCRGEEVRPFPVAARRPLEVKCAESKHIRGQFSPLYWSRCRIKKTRLGNCIAFRVRARGRLHHFRARLWAGCQFTSLGSTRAFSSSRL